MKSVLVTGHLGYIGVELVRILQEKSVRVCGCDIGLFTGCEWYRYPEAAETLAFDIRNITHKNLEGVDTIMHLAALSNDPMGALDESSTQQINYEGSIRLACLAKEAGVKKFLFAGSCSVYGKGSTLDLDEEATLNPITAYARSKIAAEEKILSLADNTFCPVSLRNATAYGSSAMLRLDLVVNNLLASAYTTGEIRVMSDGTPWRPLIHCRDIARAMVAFHETSNESIKGQAVNIGANEENYQVKDVARFVQELIPEAKVVFTGEVGYDPRNYRVNFDKLTRLLPNFQLQYSLQAGMEELYYDFVRYGMTEKDFSEDRFNRLRRLKKVFSLNQSIN